MAKPKPRKRLTPDSSAEVSDRWPSHDHMSVGEDDGRVARGIWSPENVSLLTRMWTVEGANLSEIAAALSTVVGKPVSRNAVVGKVERLGLVGKGRRAKAAPATGSENGAVLTTGKGHSGPPFQEKIEAQERVVEIAQNRKLTGNACQNPATLRSARTIEAEDTGPDLEALFGVRVTERPTHPPGRWPITDLRMGQCRFIAGDDHLCCGAATVATERNPHGSWCEAHQAVVFDERSGADRPVFVRMGGRR